MNLTICPSSLQSTPAPLPIDPHSLYCALEQVKDGRKARGKRYPEESAHPVRQFAHLDYAQGCSSGGALWLSLFPGRVS